MSGLFAGFGAFRPINKRNSTIAVAVTNASQLVSLLDVPPGGRAFQVLLTCPPANADVIYFAQSQPGINTVPDVAVPTPAIPGGVPLIPGSAQTFTLEPGTSAISVIGGGAGPDTLYLTIGQGI